MCNAAGVCTNTTMDCPPGSSCNAAGTACVDNGNGGGGNGGGGPAFTLGATAKNAPSKRP
jgi:hypothetical protein